MYDCLMNQDILIYEIEHDEYHYLRKAKNKNRIKLFKNNEYIHVWFV